MTNKYPIITAALTALLASVTIDRATAGDVGANFADSPTKEQGRPDVAAMTETNQDAFLRQAAKDRLRAERDQVAAEIRAEILYDAAKVDQAIRLINDKPADTQADNIDRCMGAFALVETKFQGPYAHYQQGLGQKDTDLARSLFDRAAQDIRLVLNSDDHTNLGAVEHYLYAAALKKAGKSIPAVEAFNKLAYEMPQRISFAAAATMEAARLYETLERNIYAMDMYTYCLANYGMTLEPSQARQIADRIAELKTLYDDPFTKLAGGMGQVQDRLAGLDTGKGTQDKEKQIAMVLRDIIQTIEEQSSANPPPPDGNTKPPTPGDPHDGEQPATGDGPPTVTPGPGTPARLSRLALGEPARPSVRGQVYDPTLAGNRMDRLPPREQDRLHALVAKVMSERYRDLISQYTARIANP